ncbi:MAG: HTH domain-containing protein, partial [Streptococcus minor]|nr:HTH domain-containing protein [Streptococcus minor]
MLLTKREKQLVKAFLQVGKLSLKEMADILQVSSRTVYRTLSDLMLTLEKQNIELIKDGRKYFLSGDVSVLEESQSTEEVSASQRLVLISYLLLTSAEPII